MAGKPNHPIAFSDLVSNFRSVYASEVGEQVMSDMFRHLDEGWGGLCLLTTGSFLASMALASDRHAMDETLRDMVYGMAGVVSAMTDHMRGRRVEQADHAKVVSEAVGRVYKVSSPFGQIVADDATARTVPAWMSHVGMVAGAWNSMQTLPMPPESVRYYRSLLLDLQDEHTSSLVSVVGSTALEWNSAASCEASDWARDASSHWMALLLMGMAPRVAAGMTYRQVGAPWLPEWYDEPEPSSTSSETSVESEGD